LGGIKLLYPLDSRWSRRTISHDADTLAGKGVVGDSLGIAVLLGAKLPIGKYLKTQSALISVNNLFLRSLTRYSPIDGMHSDG
jgi:hypothetical protein